MKRAALHFVLLVLAACGGRLAREYVDASTPDVEAAEAAPTPCTYNTCERPDVVDESATGGGGCNGIGCSGNGTGGTPGPGSGGQGIK